MRFQAEAGFGGAGGVEGDAERGGDGLGGGDGGVLLAASLFEQGGFGAGEAEAGIVEDQALQMDFADADLGGEADEVGQLADGFLEPP